MASPHLSLNWRGSLIRRAIPAMSGPLMGLGLPVDSHACFPVSERRMATPPEPRGDCFSCPWWNKRHEW
eukprot:5703244-Ditylum_brightwellii.AAC.1